MFITKIFKKTNLRITFKTNNYIEYNLELNNHVLTITINTLLLVFVNLYAQAVARCMLARQIEVSLRDLKKFFSPSKTIILPQDSPNTFWNMATPSIR